MGDAEAVDMAAFDKCENIKTINIYNRYCDATGELDAEGVTIFGFIGSPVETYAASMNYTFASLDESHVCEFVDGEVLKPATCDESGEKMVVCTVCKFAKKETVDPLTHDYVTRLEPATVEKSGIYEVKCTRCGRLSDYKKIYQIVSFRLAKTSLSYTGNVQKPALDIHDETGKDLVEGKDYDVIWQTDCKNVGTHTAKVTLKNNYEGEKTLSFKINPAKLTSATLSYTEYTYNGKTKKPTVTVKANKKTLASKTTKSNDNVTITYSTGRKNVGSYKVTIKGKGNYTGTITKTFKINPKGTTISSLKAKKTKLTVKWKKNTTQTTGYQIKYSRYSSMKSSKTVTVSSNKTTSKSNITLKKNQKYYVQIRTYKTVSGKKYYSAWSKYKTVRSGK